MRPAIGIAAMLVSWGALTACPAISLAQEPIVATRTIVNKVVPAYPALANRMQISGKVKIEVLVAPNGKVKSMHVMGGSPVFTNAATDAIEKWRWAPAPGESKEMIELYFHP